MCTVIVARNLLLLLLLLVAIAISGNLNNLMIAGNNLTSAPIVIADVTNVIVHERIVHQYVETFGIPAEIGRLEVVANGIIVDGARSLLAEALIA